MHPYQDTALWWVFIASAHCQPAWPSNTASSAAACRIRARATHAVVHRQRALGQQQLRLLASDVRVRLLLQRQRRELLQPARRGWQARQPMLGRWQAALFCVSAVAVRTATPEGLKPGRSSARYGSATLGAPPVAMRLYSCLAEREIATQLTLAHRFHGLFSSCCLQTTHRPAQGAARDTSAGRDAAAGERTAVKSSNCWRTIHCTSLAYGRSPAFSARSIHCAGGTGRAIANRLWQSSGKRTDAAGSHVAASLTETQRCSLPHAARRRCSYLCALRSRLDRLCSALQCTCVPHSPLPKHCCLVTAAHG